MNKQMKKLMIAAAVTGLVGGTTARLQAAPVSTGTNSTAKISAKSSVGKISYAKAGYQDTSKHSCKGKNDCKGQGGCKAGDNGCKGKNSCKGKGGCATDGSKDHSA
jgi:hypothetical protein